MNHQKGEVKMFYPILGFAMAFYAIIVICATGMYEGHYLSWNKESKKGLMVGRVFNLLWLGMWAIPVLAVSIKFFIDALKIVGA